MLKNAGAHFVIIGHSENRINSESDKLINLKIKSALEAKLKLSKLPLLLPPSKSLGVEISLILLGKKFINLNKSKLSGIEFF